MVEVGAGLSSLEYESGPVARSEEPVQGSVADAESNEYGVPVSGGGQKVLSNKMMTSAAQPKQRRWIM